MKIGQYLTRSSFLYDAFLSILYAWSVFQAYIYDAKTRTSGILIYLIVYGGFTLLVRSPRGVWMMNLLSVFTLPWIFTVPVIQQAGSYFGFQPVIGIIATILIGIIQGIVSAILVRWGQPFLGWKYQYALSALAAVIFTVVLSIAISMV